VTSVAPADLQTIPVRRTIAGKPLGLVEEIRDLAAHSNLLFELVRRDLTVRYKRSILGFFWTMLHPLLLMLIFLVVFANLFRFRTPHYETYFLSEYIAWVFFSQTTVNAMVSLDWNGALLKRIRVPKSIFPLASTIAGLVNLALSLVLLCFIMLLAGTPIRPMIVFLPVSLIILGLFTFGATLALSALAVFFADIREMYQAALPALLYLTPVIYPIEIIPDRFRLLLKLNPLAYVLEVVRDPIYYGILPAPRTLALAIAMSLGSLAIGWMIFRHLAPRFHGRF
jgi:ABC-type polysaccharide/polyol phosphate export permease